MKSIEEKIVEEKLDKIKSINANKEVVERYLSSLAAQSHVQKVVLINGSVGIELLIHPDDAKLVLDALTLVFSMRKQDLINEFTNLIK